MAQGTYTLVFGGSGFLGRHVLDELVRAGCETVNASRGPFTGPGIAAARFDACSQDVTRMLDELEPRSIVLCTALSHIGDCDWDPTLAELLNTELPDRVARWSARNAVRLIHVSTDLVFGDRPAPEGGLREDDPPGPVSVYGRTKAEGERLVLASYPASLVVRLPLLFGDSQGRGLGASDSLAAALDAGRKPRLFTDEWRTPLDAREAASAIVECLAATWSGYLHIAGAERIQRHELGRRLMRAAGRGADEDRLLACTRAEAGMSHRPADVSLSSALARERLKASLSAPPSA